MAGIKYVGRPKPFLTPIMCGGRMEALVEDRIDDALGVALSIAPVDSGDYKSSLTTYTEIVTNIGDGPRVAAFLTAGTDHDQFVEARYGVLARSLGG